MRCVGRGHNKHLRQETVLVIVWLCVVLMGDDLRPPQRTRLTVEPRRRKVRKVTHRPSSARLSKMRLHLRQRSSETLEKKEKLKKR